MRAELGAAHLVGVVIVRQNSRSLSTRISGELPAIKAALIAPIEIPATQSGLYSDEASAS
jgi:hypothetical protein